MAYEQFTSTLICTYCNNPFTTKNTKMVRVLCPSCKSHWNAINKVSNGKSLSQLTDEERARIESDPTVNRGFRFNIKKAEQKVGR